MDHRECEAKADLSVTLYRVDAKSKPIKRVAFFRVAAGADFTLREPRPGYRYVIIKIIDGGTTAARATAAVDGVDYV